MVTTNQIAIGSSNYIENEILPQIPKVKAIGLSTVVALYMRKLPEIMKKVPKSLELVDDSGMVDIDSVRDVLREKISGEVPIDIPLIGTITIDQTEVDKLYNYIVRS